MSEMTVHPVRRGLRAAAFAFAAATVVAACSSGGDDAAVSTTAASSTATPTSTPDVTPSIAASPAPTTVPAPPDPTQPTTPSVAGSTVPITAAPTAPPPVSIEPLAVQELVLSGDGIGSAVFGADPEGVIDYVSSILGGNTGDTGWVAPDTFAVCPGTEARRVDWGTLSLLFTDLSPIANGRRHFMGYEYGRVGQIDEEPVGLRTAGGVSRGSRVVDLLAEFPEAAINEGEPESGFPDGFYVSDVFYGLLTGTTAEDYVTVFFGGPGCFE